MALDIPSADGTVQLVVSVAVLERFLDVFPNLTVFPVPHDDNDLPTYGLTVRDLNAPYAGKLPRKTDIG